MSLLGDNSQWTSCVSACLLSRSSDNFVIHYLFQESSYNILEKGTDTDIDNVSPWDREKGCLLSNVIKTLFPPGQRF